MPRKSTIRWGESDTQKLTNEINRFNAKIYRARSNHPELRDILPETIKKSEADQMMKELQSQSRAEFNKVYNSLDRFLRKGAEKAITSKTGNRVTKWEKNEVAIKVAQINRDRTRERKKVEAMEATSRGEKLGMKRGEMGSIRMNELRPKKFNFDKIRGGKEWQKFKESVYHQASYQAKVEKMKLFKMNYIKGLTRVGGGYADEIIGKLKLLPAEKIVEIFYREQEATIDFVYSPEQLDTLLEIINSIWTNVHQDNPDSVSSEHWTPNEEEEYRQWFMNPDL